MATTETPTRVEPEVEPEPIKVEPPLPKIAPTVTPELDPDTLCPEQKKEIVRIIRRAV